MGGLGDSPESYFRFMFEGNNSEDLNRRCEKVKGLMASPASPSSPFLIIIVIKNILNRLFMRFFLFCF